MIRIDFSKLRFLVVDDNPHMRRILRALLLGFGSREVHEAADGANGLEAFTKFTPDIVIVDWAMPLVDGLELARMMPEKRRDCQAASFAKDSMLFDFNAAISHPDGASH